MVRLSGERRALAAAALAFYGFLYLLVALAPPAEGWAAAFGSLAGVYGAGFLGLVAGYFWARWYCIGLGISGVITAGFSIFQVGPEPVLMFYGGTHALIALALWGRGMADLFDGRKEWRERFHLDEMTTDRLGKSVVRLGVSLPYVVLYALAPKDGAGMALALTGGALIVAGTWALLRMRTWGMLALAGGAVATLASVAGLGCGGMTAQLTGTDYAIHVGALGIAGLVAVTAALAPMMAPVVRYLRR